MKMQKSGDAANIRKITHTMKQFFFLSFASLVIYGMLPENAVDEYVPKKISGPVFSHQVDTAVKEENDEVFSLYTEVLATPTVSAQSAALVSADTGELIYGCNSNKMLPMASTTKIMTALVVLENANLDTVFTVPQEVCGTEGSSIYLSPGEKITIRDLLYGLMLESGNDAASALAVACCGSTEAFAEKMNTKAKELGLISTSFKNPHGLSADGHYTTAYELAKITYHAMKNPVFRQITSTKNYTVTNSEGVPTHYFANHNKMLRTYSGANGVKTGYTIASGRCLVSSAERDGSSFIAVTLNDRNDWRDHAEMLDFAFENYKAKNYFKENEFDFTFDGVSYSNAEDISVVVPHSTQKIELDIVLAADKA